MTRHLGGWWRLWIVLAIIYGGIVITYTMISWPNASKMAHHPAFIYQMTSEAKAIIDRPKTLVELEHALVAADRNGATEKAREYARQILQIRNNGNWEDVPLVLEMPNGHKFEVAGDTTPEQTSLVSRDYTRALKSAETEARISAVITALVIWLIPSAIACALGLAVAWICRGFNGDRRES